MKSLKILPLEKRDKATVKQLLEALETAENELSPFTNSFLADSYLTLFFQLKDWNKQLKIEDGKGKIDLFSDKDDKSFERSFKYFNEIRDLNKTLTLLKADMTQEEKQEVDTAILDESSILEKHLLSKKV